ncbi:HAD-IIB family hydrolase [Arenicella xantha]|uniref:Mannosyl-3-phosphoglycerate phosphatase n=1 Tax=Arenicella xantha TaxID=644221 RepID=A0A395JI92_9GAMM|nr:HAD-IIB family hydrolase [Arenicella xantha]RBP49309.1 mannosyl-3-phosphoglycerate phosphatase [Arenicella xantha]
MTRANLIVSTDLDGTLLDHNTYSYAAALPALTRCKTLGVPVILNTSKTFAEVVALQQALDISAPLVVENGSALSFDAADINISNLPENQFEVVQDAQRTTLVFGVKRSAILDFISALRRETTWQFAGFNDWTAAEIASNTGLDLASAELASQKQYSEPIVWQDDDLSFAGFEAAVATAGFSLLKGGRFIHIQGHTDKARPLTWLKQHPQMLFPDSDGNIPPKLICLGDSHNDVAMLNVADFPVCVRSPIADYPSLATEHPIIRTHGFGPVGWNEALETLLS